MKQYIPDRGDVVWLDFDPSRGKEIMKRRPAFVISRKMFNEHVNMAIVAPITNTVRGIKLEVILPDTMSTQGSVLVYQIRTLDFEHRNAELIEKAPQDITDKVGQLVKIIIH